MDRHTEVGAVPLLSGNMYAVFHGRTGKTSSRQYTVFFPIVKHTAVFRSYNHPILGDLQPK
jgi:hypothetical protein